jgi:hypothetical protein
MEVRIEINTEENQVKKTASTCQLKAGHKYKRPIIFFKNTENFQYLATRVNKPKLHLKNQTTFFLSSRLSNQNLLSSYLGHHYDIAKNLPVVLQSVKVSPVTLWAERGSMQMRTGR